MTVKPEDQTVPLASVASYVDVTGDGTKVGLLEIPAGKVLIFSEKLLFVDRLVMREGSTLQLDGQETFEIRATLAYFGPGAKIIGDGLDGNDGEDATGIPKQAGYGQQGHDGNRGEIGSDGEAGTTIDIEIGLEALNNLTISVSGGDGGNGGVGGRGGKGGAAPHNCDKRGGRGGTGGVGGDAGRGGNGGSVNLRYWNAMSPEVLQALASDIAGKMTIQNLNDAVGLTVRNGGGEPGVEGVGGAKGTPGEGRRCGFVKRRGGHPGLLGKNGPPASEGQDGSVNIKLLPRP